MFYSYVKQYYIESKQTHMIRLCGSKIAQVNKKLLDVLSSDYLKETS